jgi:ribosomal subunit interface protein
MGNTARKFEQEGANISILGRNFQITAPMREYILGKMAKICDLIPQATEVKVLLEIQKEEHKGEIILHFSHFHITVHATKGDVYQAFDECCAKLKGKLRKWKTQIQEHHTKNIFDVEISSQVFDRKKEELFEINDMIEEENFHEIEEEFCPLMVMKRGKKRIATLTVDEASMRFDLSSDPFLVYREEKDQKLKVMWYDKDHELTVLELE